MKKNIPIMLIAGAVLVVGVGTLGYFLTRANNNGNSTKNSALSVNFSEPICDQVSSSVVGDAIGQSIANTKPTTGNITNVCKYYLDDTNYVTLRLNKLNYETQKSGTEKSGAKISTDSSIGTEHFIVTAPTGQMANITIKINDNLILTIERSSADTISNDKFIALAGQVVEELQKDTSNTDESSNSESSGKELITNFFKSIDDGKASEAVLMMSKQNTSDDSTKQAWGVQFNSMNSVKVVSVEEFEQSSWTDSKQQYKVTLDISMDPDSADEPIPYYGYDNGKNIRFINLVKEDGDWKVDGISTGP